MMLPLCRCPGVLHNFWRRACWEGSHCFQPTSKAHQQATTHKKKWYTPIRKKAKKVVRDRSGPTTVHQHRFNQWWAVVVHGTDRCEADSEALTIRRTSSGWFSKLELETKQIRAIICIDNSHIVEGFWPSNNINTRQNHTKRH